MIVGKFSSESKYLKDSVNRLNCKPKIVDEYVPSEVMEGFLHNAKMLVMPYLDIDDSGVFAQARFFKVPILASNIGVFKEKCNGSFSKSF